MYEEFLIGYILSAAAILLLVAVLVLQCVILKKMSHRSTPAQESAYHPYSKGKAYGSQGMAVCRNCATQFSAAHNICPKCGTPR